MSDLIQTFKSKLDIATPSLGFNLNEVEQGSYEWLRAKLGVASASNASALLAKQGSATRDGYMAVLIGEIATGAPLDGVQASGRAIEWGHEQEGAAREMLSMFTDLGHIDQFPFVYGDGMRFGCSPDGLLSHLNRGVEIKCPWNTRYHIEFIVDGRIKKEYMDQVQFSMWVTGLNEWEFASFDPRMKREMLKHQTVERSEQYMAKFDKAVPEFIKEMDAKLKLIGFDFGDQWK